MTTLRKGHNHHIEEKSAANLVIQRAGRGKGCKTSSNYVVETKRNFYVPFFFCCASSFTNKRCSLNGEVFLFFIILYFVLVLPSRSSSLGKPEKIEISRRRRRD